MDSPRAAPAASPTPPREDIRIVEAPPAAPEALPLVTQLSPVDPAPAPVMTATLLPPGQALPEEIVVTAPPPFATWSSDERAPARARTRGQPAPASEWAASTTVAAFAELRDMPVRGVSNPAMSGTNAASAEAAAPSGASTEGGQRRSEGAAQVQFLAAGSEAGAQAEWARLQSRVPELANRSPVITRFEREGFPTFWRVRADGFTDAADARAFCAQLRSRAVNCMPVGG